MLVTGLVTGSGAVAGSSISNNLSRCSAGKGPAVLVTVRGIRSSSGKMRLQSYRAVRADWLKKGRWLNRIETRASRGTMRFCVPVPRAGSYGVAIRHDRNGNGRTDITKDGGGMSRNPSINILNLGKPSVKKVSFYAGAGVTRITINMKYM
ncbi:MAG: DUF2141 domain-containing protein [Sphingorhabdus sp.]